MPQTKLHWERTVATLPASSPFPAEAPEGNSLVFDLGRDTFQVSVLARRGGQTRVLARGGYGDLGGDDLHLPICAWASDAILRETGTVAEADPETYAALLERAEACKRELSGRERSRLTLDTPGCRWSGILTRADYRAMIAPLCRRMEGKAVEILAQSALGLEDIDRIVYLGDACRAEQVRAPIAGRWEAAQREKRARVAREEARRAEELRRAKREAEEARARALAAQREAEAQARAAQAKARAAQELDRGAAESRGGKDAPVQDSADGGAARQRVHAEAPQAPHAAPSPSAPAKEGRRRDLRRANTMFRALRRSRRRRRTVPLLVGVVLFLAARCSEWETGWLKGALFALIEGELPAAPDMALVIRAGVTAAAALPVFLWQFHRQQITGSWGSERHGAKLAAWGIGAWGIHTAVKYLCRIVLLPGSEASALVVFTLQGAVHSLTAALLLPLVWSLTSDTLGLE